MPLAIALERPLRKVDACLGNQHAGREIAPIEVSARIGQKVVTSLHLSTRSNARRGIDFWAFCKTWKFHYGVPGRSADALVFLRDRRVLYKKTYTCSCVSEECAGISHGSYGFVKEDLRM